MGKKKKAGPKTAKKNVEGTGKGRKQGPEGVDVPKTTSIKAHKTGESPKG